MREIKEKITKSKKRRRIEFKKKKERMDN